MIENVGRDRIVSVLALVVSPYRRLETRIQVTVRCPCPSQGEVASSRHINMGTVGTELFECVDERGLAECLKSVLLQSARQWLADADYAGCLKYCSCISSHEWTRISRSNKLT